MIDFRPIVFVLGVLLSIIAVAMMLPAVVDAASGHPDWQVFAAAALLTLFVGVAMMLTARSGWVGFSLRQAFIMTNLAWLVIAAFGALPLAFSELEMSITDAFFEAMSGITTTGTPMGPAAMGGSNGTFSRSSATWSRKPLRSAQSRRSSIERPRWMTCTRSRLAS